MAALLDQREPVVTRQAHTHHTQAATARSNREQRQCAISDGGEPLTSSAVGESARRARHARASKARTATIAVRAQAPRVRVRSNVPQSQVRRGASDEAQNRGIGRGARAVVVVVVVVVVPDMPSVSSAVLSCLRVG